MKRFLKTSGVLLILLFQFTGCLNYDDNKNPVYYFYDEPVVVTYTGDFLLVNNQSYSFYVSGLTDNTSLKEGNLLWTSFTVDIEEQPPTVFSVHYYTARHFRYQTVDSARVIIPENVEEFQSYLADDYSEPIELSLLHKYIIDRLWFFSFKHRDHSNHIYELILNPELEDSIYPTLYIRSKKVNTSNEQQAKDHLNREVFAFDVTDFAPYNKEKNSSSDVIRFNLKYKVGVDSEGNDIYRGFSSNPITWNFNNRQK